MNREKCINRNITIASAIISGVNILLLRLLNITIFNSHIFQYISACYA